MKKKSIILSVVSITLIAFVLFFTTTLIRGDWQTRLVESPVGVIFGKYKPFFFIWDLDQAWTPSIEDVKKGEVALSTCARIHHPNVYKKLDQYRRQYVGIYDDEGNKRLFINAFIPEKNNEHTEWKNVQVLVMDGGDNYFEATINLDYGLCPSFSVHGNA